MKPTFDQRMEVTFGQSNATGNVYFLEYLRLQGIARELWVKHCVANAKTHLASGLLLSTKSVHCDFKKPFFTFDTILVRMHVEELQRVSALLVFEYLDADTGALHATGWQIIVFKNASRRTCRMPEDFREAALKITWPATELRPDGAQAAA